MSELCSQCRGEGECYDDWSGGWLTCSNCGGEGRVDPYQQDEWYEEVEHEITDEEWADYCEWLAKGNADESTALDQSLTPPSPTVEDDHEFR